MRTPLNPPTAPRSIRRAFTLVELLVSISVLSLLLVMVTQLVNSTSTVTVTGNKRLDADSQARLLFDRMALDFERIVKRADVDYYFQQNTGNDQMAFYSEATGYYPSGVTGSTPKSGVSLIGYRVTSNYQLERLSKSLVWNGATSSTADAGGLTGSDIGMVFLPKTLTGSWPKVADGTDSNYQVIADQVYRLEYNFLLKPYTDASGATHPAVLSVTPWDTRQSHTTPNGLCDVSAVVVAVAILDETSRKIVQTGQYTAMVSELTEASGSSSILQVWNGSNYLTGSGISQAATSQIRIYQRYFYLN